MAGPTVESLQVNYDAASLAAGMATASAGAERFAAALDKVNVSSETNDQILRKTTPSIDTINRAMLGTEATTAKAEIALRNYQRTIAGVAREEAILGGATEQTRLLRERASAQLDIELAKATKYGDAIEKKFGSATASVNALSDALNNANRMMANSQTAFNASTGITGGAGAAKTSTAPLIASNPLYGNDYAARAADLAAYGVAVDNLRAKLNPLFATLQQQETLFAEAADAYKVGAVGALELAAAQTRLTDTFRAQMSSLQQISEATRTATTAQAAWNATTVAANPLYGTEYAKRAADIEAYGAALDQARAKFDPLFAASKRYEAVLDEISSLEKVGALSANTAAAARERETKAFSDQVSPAKALGLTQDGVTNSSNKLGASTGNMIFAMRQLGVQSVQAASGLMTNQSAMTVLIQQGHQLVDVALSTGTGFSVLGAAAKAAWGFINTPLGWGAVAVVSLGALAIAAELTTERIGTLRNELSLVRSDFDAAATAADQAAKHLAATTPVSTTDARAGINAVYNQGGLFTGTKAQAEELVAVNAKLAAQLGEVAVNAQRAGEIIANPAGVLQTLLRDHPEIRVFDQNLVDSVKHLQEMGKQGEAVGVTFDVLKRITADWQPPSPLIQAWQNLEKAISSADRSGKSFAATLGGPVLTSITGALNVTANLVTAVKRLIDSIPPWVFTVASNASTVAFYSNPAMFGLGIGAAAIAPGGPFSGVSGLAKPASVPSPEFDIGLMSKWVESFVRQGTDLNVAIAGAASVMRESSGNFQSVNMKDAPGGSHGGFMWNNGRNNDTINGRLAGFQAANGGLLPEQTSIDAQVAYAIQELNTTYAGTYATLKATTDLATQASVFVANFEIPKDIPGQSAISAAIATRFKAAYDGTGSATDMAALSNNKVAADAAPLASSTTEAQRQKLLEDRQKIESALQLPNLDSTKLKEYGQALDEAQLKLYNAKTASELLVRTLELQTAEENVMTSAWGQGAVAAARATDVIKAENSARSLAAPGTAQYSALVFELTAKYSALATAQERSKIAQADLATKNQETILNAQINTIGMESEARQALIQHMKNEQDVLNQFPRVSEAERQARVQNLDQVNAMTQSLQRQQKAVDDLANGFVQGFDTIGNGITQSLLQGQGAAVSWKNVMTSAAQQVLQQFVKLAFINPLINSLLSTSTHQSTLSDLFQALSQPGTATGTSGGTSGSSGVVNALGTGSSVLSGGSSLLELLGYKSIGTQLGLTGEGGLLTGLGTKLGLTGEGGLFNGAGSSISGFMNTPLTSLNAADTFAESTGGAAGLGGGATVGSVLGAAGAGFAVGSLLGTGTQMLSNKTGPGPEIGAAVGTAAGIAGVLLAPETFGTSLLLAGLIGGAAGGIGGGLIGPRPPSAFSSTGVTLENGQLAVGNSVAQRDTNPGPSTASDAGIVNSYLSANGLALTSIGALAQIGQNTPGQTPDPGKFPDIATAFPAFKFSSTDPILNKFLSDRKYPDLDTLAADVTHYQQLVTNVIPALTTQTKVTGSLNDALDKINATFDPAIAAATSFGIATDELTKAQAKAIETTKAAATAQLAASDAAVRGNYLTARASITGSVADSQAASLLAFDTGAQPQRDALKTLLVSIYGDVYTSTADFAGRMTALDDTLNAQRSAIVVGGARTAFTTAQSALVTALNGQISATQTQIGALTTNSNALHTAADSLRAFITGLSVSAQSPLSPADQLAAAKKQFAVDLTGKDATSAAAAQGDATTLLTLAGAYYGKATTAYQDVFNSTVASLNSMQAALTAQASTADQTLTALTSQLSLEQQQLAVAQAVGTAVTQSISVLTASMLDAFAQLQASLVAAGLSPGLAGQNPYDAAKNLGTPGVLDPTATITALYQADLGRAPDTGGLAYYLAQVASGGLTLSGVAATLKNSPEGQLRAAAGLAAGGWVGNGQYNQDSVLARYADGGSIALAGGEYVMSAPSAARYADVLPSMNSGRFANDNSAIITELRAIRAKLADIEQRTAQGALAVTGELKSGHAVLAAETASRRMAGRRS